MSFWDRWRGKRVKLTDGSFWTNFFGSGSYAGESVSEQSVLGIGAAYACVRKISEGVSCLPFEVMEVTQGRLMQRAENHRLERILGDVVNADMTAQQYWELVTLQIALRGNHYSLRLMDGNTLIGLEPLPCYPDTRCERDKKGARRFIVTAGPRKGEYSEDEIFFIPGFGTDIDCGLSVISSARHVFGRMQAAEKHTSRVFANGARPNMVMTSPEVLTDTQRADVKRNLIDPFTSSENSGGVMFLEGGFVAKPIDLSPADLQLLEQSKFGVEEVCRLFGVPPWLIGHTSGNSNWGTGLEQQFRAYATLTLTPYVKRIIGEVRRQLMTPGDRRKYRPQMSMDMLLRGDLKTEAEIDAIYVRGGIDTQNERRARRGLPPKEGGDELIVQQQMIPASQMGGSNV